MYGLKNHVHLTITLESEINVPVRLLILKDFPTRTALISDCTFIQVQATDMYGAAQPDFFKSETA